MAAAPLISILMPFRSSADTLRSAAESVLHTDLPVELIAIDDNDAGQEEAKHLPADSRIRVQSTGGIGIAPALEAGRAIAAGRYIARMDADDISLPGRFEAQQALLNDSPATLALVGTQAEVFGPRAGDGIRHYVDWQNGLLSPAQHRKGLFVESPLCHPSTMMRADALAQVGGYRHGDFPEDYDLWLRFDAAGYAMAKVPRVGVRWRQSEGQATFTDDRYRRAAFLQTKAPHLARRIQRVAPERPLVVWGAGQTGKRVARALEPHGLRAAAFIDIDPKKLGGVARGAPIIPIEDLDHAAFVVVALGSRGARQEACTALDALGRVEGADYLAAS